MSSQTFLDKLVDTRVAIQALVTAIMTTYYNKDTVDQKLEDVQRFQRPLKATVLEAPIRLIPDNSTGTCTYTLPSAPVDGDVVEWRPSGTAFSVHQLVFSRNGNSILGLTQDLTVDADGSCGRLLWSSVDNTWLVDTLGTAL